MLSRFSLSLVFRNFIMMCLIVDFFGFILLRFVQHLEFLGLCLLLNVIILQVPASLFIFQSIFSFLFILDNFLWTIFKFIGSLLWHFHSAIEPITWVFISVIIVYSSKLSIWFTFISFISLLRLSIFSFVSKMFMIAC